MSGVHIKDDNNQVLYCNDLDSTQQHPGQERGQEYAAYELSKKWQELFENLNDAEKRLVLLNDAADAKQKLSCRPDNDDGPKAQEMFDSTSVISVTTFQGLSSTNLSVGSGSEPPTSLLSMPTGGLVYFCSNDAQRCKEKEGIFCLLKLHWTQRDYETPSVNRDARAQTPNGCVSWTKGGHLYIVAILSDGLIWQCPCRTRHICDLCRRLV